MSISNERPSEGGRGGGTPPSSYRSSFFNRCMSIAITIILMCVGLLILVLGSGCLTHPERQFQITEQSANTSLTSPVCQAAAGTGLGVGGSMIVVGGWLSGWWLLGRATVRVIECIRRRCFQNRANSSLQAVTLSGGERNGIVFSSNILRRILLQSLLASALIIYGILLVRYAIMCLIDEGPIHRSNETRVQTQSNTTAVSFLESSCQEVSILDVVGGVALMVAGFVFGILMRRQIFPQRPAPTATIEELPEEIPLTDLPPSTDVTELQQSTELTEDNGEDDPDMPPLEE